MDSKSGQATVKKKDLAQKREPVPILPGAAIQQFRQQLDSIVREHAYQLYQTSGGNHGRDLGHWVEAESKLISSNLEVRESGPWFHCNCEVPAITAGNIQVAIDGEQILIHLSGDIPLSTVPTDRVIPIFYWAKWPQKVDPSTAAAYVVDTNLTIEVKKAEPPQANPVVKPTN